MKSISIFLALFLSINSFAATVKPTGPELFSVQATNNTTTGASQFTLSWVNNSPLPFKFAEIWRQAIKPSKKACATIAGCPELMANKDAAALFFKATKVEVSDMSGAMKLGAYSQVDAAPKSNLYGYKYFAQFGYYDAVRLKTTWKKSKPVSGAAHSDVVIAPAPRWQPLGLRSFNIASNVNGDMAFFLSLFQGTNMLTTFEGSPVVNGGAFDSNGVAPLSVPNDYILHLFLSTVNKHVYIKVLSNGSSGQLDCGGYGIPTDIAVVATKNADGTLSSVTNASIPATKPTGAMYLKFKAIIVQSDTEKVNYLSDSTLFNIADAMDITTTTGKNSVTIKDSAGATVASLPVIEGHGYDCSSNIVGEGHVKTISGGSSSLGTLFFANQFVTGR